MKIAIIGASGMAGSAIYKEAVGRGHDVTGFVRNVDKALGILGADAKLVAKDAFDLTKADLAAYDVVVDAFNSPRDQAYLHVDLATRLVHELRETTSPRLIFVVGAGSLLMPDGRKLVEHLKENPAASSFLPTPINHDIELDFLSHVDNVSWLAISPSENFQPGPKSAYRLGDHEVLFNNDGSSVLTSGNMALVMLDEIEKPTHFNTRITAIDAE